MWGGMESCRRLATGAGRLPIGRRLTICPTKTLAVAVLFCGTADAQKAALCEGPPELRSAISAKPSEDAYSALGFWFVDRGNLPCAISAFRSAVTLNGESV